MNSGKHAGSIAERMREFLADRVAVAGALHRLPSATYQDQALILCSVLSACAAIKWPGSGIDRQRFVELLVVESPSDMNCSWVSLPSLVRAGLVNESLTPMGQPSKPGKTWTDVEVDMDVESALQKFPGLGRAVIQQHSYASLLFEWLLCGYAQEYLPNQSLTTVPETRRRTKISYIGRLVNGKNEWTVAIHLNYLAELAGFHASNVMDQPKERPPRWWLESPTAEAARQ